MNLNLTLLGQMLTFAVFVFFTMRYVWPPMTRALDERQKKIADGLAAAEKGVRDLELAERQVRVMLEEAKLKASQMIEESNRRAGVIVEEGKEQARSEAKQILQHGEEALACAKIQAAESLRQEVGSLAVKVAEQILKKNMDINEHQVFIDRVIEEIGA